jgi:hypothetical protein
MFSEWAGSGASSFFETKKLEQKNFVDTLLFIGTC